MRILILSAISIATIATPSAPVAAEATVAVPQQIAALDRRDVPPQQRTAAIQADAPIERVDRPIVRTRRSDERNPLRRELALLAF